MKIDFCGKKVSEIGVGTWHMGGTYQPDHAGDKRDIAALKLALDNGVNVIDTAEMYAAGHAEELVCDAIKGFDREELFIVTKVLPSHLGHDDLIKSAKASLKRLGSKYIDLYLIHWLESGSDIGSAISTMEGLVDQGIVRNIGVSNFGTEQLEKAMASAKRYEIAANQIKYSLAEKHCEKEVVPFCEKNGIRVIAYSPLARGKVADMREVVDMASRIGKTPMQVGLNYLMRRSLPIPKASSPGHLMDVLGSTGWRLEESDYAKLSAL